jgi:hypothetical protein
LAGFDVSPEAIRIKKGEKTVLETEGSYHDETALARSENVIFVADFSPIASGCAVTAYDLETGRKLWHTALVGIGPTAHSRYYNRVQMDVIEEVLVIRGWEAHGKYIECLATASGRAVWHEKLDDK